MARMAAIAALLLTLAVASVAARPGPAVNVNAWAEDIVGALKVNLRVFSQTSRALVGHARMLWSLVIEPDRKLITIIRLLHVWRLRRSRAHLHCQY